MQENEKLEDRYYKKSLNEITMDLRIDKNEIQQFVCEEILRVQKALDELKILAVQSRKCSTPEIHRSLCAIPNELDYTMRRIGSFKKELSEFMKDRNLT